MATTSWTGAIDGDINNAGNWDNGIPGASDDVLIPENAQRAMDTNMAALTALKFNLIFIGRGNAFNIGGAATPLECAATKLVHQGDGSLYFRTSASNATDEIIINSDNTVYAADILKAAGAADVTHFRVIKGNVNCSGSFVATNAWVAYRNNRISDATLAWTSGGPGNFFVLGGQVTLDVIPTFMYIDGGLVTNRLIAGGGSLTTVYQTGGRWIYSTDNSILTQHLYGGTCDFTQRTGKLAITNLYKHPDAKLYKSDDLVTITNTWDFTGGDMP